jgi:hypothetical protein
MKKKRGFATMNPETLRALARKGGQAALAPWPIEAGALDPRLEDSIRIHRSRRPGRMGTGSPVLVVEGRAGHRA